MRTLRVAILGFGNAGQAFGRLILDKHATIKKDWDTDVKVVAIATGRRGSCINEAGIFLEEAWDLFQKGLGFPKGYEGRTELDSIEIAKNVDYDVLVELTPLNIFTGQPAILHIETAINRGRHVITANKGPIAWAYENLRQKAEDKGVQFLYETTVMDGTPIFNLVEDTLPLCQVQEVKGILNSTTNYVLGELEKGIDYDTIMMEGKRRGFVEADPSLDLEGWDAAAKTAALLNVLMRADLTPDRIQRKGIEDIHRTQVLEAAKKNKKIKLVCRGLRENGVVVGSVNPEEIPMADLYANMDGTTSIISITTDLMGTLSIVEHDPEILQTGYGVFSDFIRLIRRT